MDGNNIGFLLVVGRSALLSLPSHLKTPLPSLYNPNCLTLGNDNETIPLKKRLHERSKCSWRKERIELESSVNPQKIKANKRLNLSWLLSKLKKYCKWKVENETLHKTITQGEMVRSEGNEQNVESYVAIIANIDGTEETEIYGDRKDHANTLSNWVTISKFLSFFLSLQYHPNDR